MKALRQELKDKPELKLSTSKSDSFFVCILERLIRRGMS